VSENEIGDQANDDDTQEKTPSNPRKKERMQHPFHVDHLIILVSVERTLFTATGAPTNP
jgi:hypothetical protein